MAIVITCPGRFPADYVTHGYEGSLASSVMVVDRAEADVAMESGIAFIENAPDNPFDLFKQWFKEVGDSGYLLPETLVFSTCSTDGAPRSRTLFMRRLDDDGLVIVTDNRSNKVKEIEQNPKVSIIFIWNVMKNGCKESRQVRMEGIVKKLPLDQYAEIYEREPLFCKLRSHVCVQGEPVTWNTIKETHDRLYAEYKSGKNTLPMPDWFVGFKFYPTMFDFYFSYGNHFADRVHYLNEGEQWRNYRLSA